MKQSLLLSFIHLITIITISTGFNHDRRFHTLEDPHNLPDLAHAHGNNIPLHQSRNTKRMTIDDTARTRESWGQIGQMNSEYYRNPMQYPQQQPQPQQQQPQPQQPGNYYQQVPAAGNNYFSTTAPSNPGQMANIFKSMNNDQMQKKQGQPRPKIPKIQSGVETYDYERVGMSSNNGKKVKILICRLQQGQN